MKIAICDDDKLLGDTLKQFIQETYPPLDHPIDLFYSGEELLDSVRKVKKPYEILFLDIEMAGLDGMEVAKIWNDSYPDTFIIFITSHDDLAALGYEVSAFRFITKPINKRKIIEAIEAVKAKQAEVKSISFQNKDGEYVLPIKEIRFFEAQNQNVMIKVQDESIIHRINIREYEEMLQDDGFYRVHRSYLVNMRFIKAVIRRDVVLKTGESIPVSRLKMKEFMAAFRRYIKRSAV